MSQRNCPNCGAPYDTTLSTCPYCGTSYFDMSAIDICDRKPFYLKLRHGNMVFTSLVIVKPDVSIEICHDTVAITDNRGRDVSRLNHGSRVEIDMGFESIYRPEAKTIATIELEE